MKRLMKCLLCAALALLMTVSAAITGLAELNSAQKNANLYKQENLYDKDFRSYDADAFDLSALPDCTPEEEISGCLLYTSDVYKRQAQTASGWRIPRA